MHQLSVLVFLPVLCADLHSRGDRGVLHTEEPAVVVDVEQLEMIVGEDSTDAIVVHGNAWQARGLALGGLVLSPCWLFTMEYFLA